MPSVSRGPPKSPPVRSPPVTWHGLSLIGTLVTIGVTVAFLAGLYDLTFLSEYLGARPQDGPGYEHLLFSVLANVLSTRR